MVEDKNCILDSSSEDDSDLSSCPDTNEEQNLNESERCQNIIKKASENCLIEKKNKTDKCNYTENYHDNNDSGSSSSISGDENSDDSQDEYYLQNDLYEKMQDDIKVSNKKSCFSTLLLLFAFLFGLIGGREISYVTDQYMNSCEDIIKKEINNIRAEERLEDKQEGKDDRRLRRNLRKIKNFSISPGENETPLVKDETYHLSKDPCQSLRSIFHALPYRFKPSDKKLIIGASQGTTGTRWNQAYLITLGYNIAHWKSIKPVGPKIIHWYKPLLSTLLALSPQELKHFDFNQFGDKPVSGVMDTPTADFLPYYLKAYPNARVIITQRDPAPWLASRYTNHKGMCTFPSFYHLYNQKNAFTFETVARRRVFETSVQFELQNTFSRCVVPSEHIVEGNLWTQNITRVKEEFAELVKDIPVDHEVKSSSKKRKKSHHG